MTDYTLQYFQNPSRARYQLTDLLKSQIEALPPKAKVIDLGCGDLTLLRSICTLRADLELHGVDTGDLPAGTELNGISYTKADIQNFSTTQKFKLALAIDVLEHLPMPQHLVQLAGRILEGDGEIYVTAPNTTKLLLLGDENFYSDYTHVRPFNPKALSRLLEDNGFRPRSINTVGIRGRKRYLRFFYYLIRGIISINPRYINAAITLVGGSGVEAIADRI